MGTGCFYAIRSLLQKLIPTVSIDKTVQIVLIEPFSEILASPEFAEQLESFRLQFSPHPQVQILTEKEFESQSSKLPKTSTTLRLFHPAYERWMPDLREHYSSQNLATEIDKATIQEFSLRWTSHYIKNLESIGFSLWNRSQKTASLFSTKQVVHFWAPDLFFQNFKRCKTWVYVGASPTLEEEWDRLQHKVSSEDCFILVSDTAIRPVLAKGLLPNGILSIDPGRGTLYHFAEKIPKDIPIYTWLGGQSEIFSLPNPKIVFFTNHPLDQFLLSALQQTKAPSSEHYAILENPSRNLAGMARSIAISAGATELEFFGLSLVSHRGKTHLRGTGYEVYDLPRGSRKTPLESLQRKTYKPQTTMGKNQLTLQEIQKPLPIPHSTFPISPTDKPLQKESFHSSVSSLPKGMETFYFQLVFDQLPTPGIQSKLWKKALGRIGGVSFSSPRVDSPF